MKIDLRKMPTAISLAIAIVASSVFAFAQIDLVDSDKEITSTPSSGIVFGKLLTTGNNLILANGSGVPSGTSLISPTQIRTPEGVRASIVIKSLGRVDLGSNASILLNFSPGRIDLDLQEGCLVLTTFVGTRGSIKTSQGTIENIGPDEQTTTDVCTADEGKAEAMWNRGAAKSAGVGVGVDTADSKRSRRRVSPWIFAIGPLPFVISDVPRSSSSRPEPII